MSATGQALNTARPETFLAFDVGRKRTGVAYASRFLGHAEPQGSIQAEGDRRWPLVARHIETWQPQALVVGVPFHPDGAEHDNTRFARRFARELRQRFALPVFEVDERYSTTEALAQGARDADAASACIILEQFLRNDVPTPEGHHEHRIPGP
jgi:putative Holliday junction resolvase